MIKLNKGPKPKILVDNEDTWKNELLAVIATGQKVPDTVYNRYNNDQIKDALRIECSDKCMYCESPIAHISYEHIEHIKPKAKNKYPALTYEWDNLGLACQVCNMNKGDTYDLALPFINPYSEDPSSFLFPYGNFIWHKTGNKRGELTKLIIKLNRPELIERRQERFELISTLIKKYNAEENAILKKALKEEIEIEIGHDKPYSFCAKSIYNLMMS